MKEEELEFLAHEILKSAEFLKEIYEKLRELEKRISALEMALKGGRKRPITAEEGNE